MGFKNVFLSFLLGCTANILAAEESCQIETYFKIYRLNPSQNLNYKDVVKNSNCNDLVLNKFAGLLTTLEGNVHSKALEQEFQLGDNSTHITITPNKFSIGNINDLLKAQATADTNLYFTETKLTSNKKILGLNENENVEVTCDNCLIYGDRNVKLDIVNPINATRVTSWANTKIVAKIRALKASNNINFQKESFTKEDFFAEDLYTTEPSRFISDFDNIKFYKPNKAIIKGMPITTMDIQPIQLVKYGTPVKIILKNQNINIIKNAIPHRAGVFGEVIELKNPTNNKLLTGKVVDFNKVMIEL